MIDLELAVVFIQESDESDPSVPRKLDLKRNAEGCHGREKTKSF